MMRHYGLLLVLLLGFGFSVNGQQPAPPVEEHTVMGKVTSAVSGNSLVGVKVTVKGTNTHTTTKAEGRYRIIAKNADVLVYSLAGYTTQEISVGNQQVMNVVLQLEGMDAIQTESYAEYAPMPTAVNRGTGSATRDLHSRPSPAPTHLYHPAPPNRESYAEIEELGFVRPSQEALSTFSIDVDRASYSNLRRFLNLGQRPPEDAVRIEEMVNYFDYAYPQPGDDHPFSINTELAAAPWAPKHYLLHIGLQGKEVPTEDLPPTNLVFLVDVSGSMNSPNKLGLLKSSLRLLTEKMRPQDRVAMVVYAGAAGVVLPSTDGTQKSKILNALDQLVAGGSTAGGAGIELAYQLAQENFMEEGNNRVILCTDGDFNIGVSSHDGLEGLIERKRDQGVFLTVLGYGMGNYQDSKMEILADKGNGNYAYIDNIQEAHKVLVHEFGGTLFTIAQDVKIQIEFNPHYVAAYRLIGYENRMLAAEDFNNDKKDAGELGSGHTVTALYEIVPVGVSSDALGSVDPLRYQQNETEAPAGIANGELATVKFRYKAPRGTTSTLMVQPISSTPARKLSTNFGWSASVAEFGLLLRDSEYKGGASYERVLATARENRGDDEEGYRAEFIRLVESARLLEDSE